jgi:hypothetical protein
MKTVKWYKSQTYWFNISLAIIGLVEANVGLLKNNLGDYYGISVLVIGAMGIILRNTSTKPIG